VDTVDEPCKKPASRPGTAIDCQNQALSQVVPLTGTLLGLHYQSDRVPGRTGSLLDARTQRLGGWTLDIRHTYDPASRTLYLGNGDRRSADALGLPIQVGTETLIAAEDGGKVFVFDESGRHRRTLDGLTGAVRHAFTDDSEGRLTAITDGDNRVTTIERDATGTPSAIVGPDGQRTSLTLDTDGFLATITNPVGEIIQLDSTPDGLLTGLTDARGHGSSFRYDGQGRLVGDEAAAEDGASTTVDRTDSNAGHTVTLTTAEGRMTRYQVEFLPTGDERRRTTLPSGLQTEWVKAADGTRTSRVPDGTVTTLEQGPDPRWGMQVPLPARQTLTTPGGLSSTTTAERTAALADPENPLSLIREINTIRTNSRPYTDIYEAASRILTRTTPAGRQATRMLDANGRVVQAQVAGLSSVHYDYDADGQLSRFIQGTGPEARITTFGYDDHGFLETVTDPLTRTEHSAYDLAGRLRTYIQPDHEVIEFTYDAHGNLTTLTPPGRPVHTFTYTLGDQPSAYRPPNLGPGSPETRYTYNLDRQLTRAERPDGQVVDVRYDEAGRLSALTFPGGKLLYTYDAATGTLATLAAPRGIDLAYTYDGSLLLEETWKGPVAGRVSLTYDQDLRLRTRRIVDSDPILFDYDADSLLTQAGALTLSRHPQNGLLTGSTLGGLTDAWEYNGFAEPTSYTSAFDGNSLYEVRYTRDPLGRLTEKQETIVGMTITYGYTYDPAGRLQEVRQNGVTVASYTYDANGNWLTFTSATGALEGYYDAQDRLTQYGSATYSYSANGELRSKTIGGQTTTYDYDALGNLLAVTLPSGTQITYLADGQHRRIGKEVNGTLAQGFLYQDGLRPVAELDGASNVISRFVYASRRNVPDYLIKAGVTYRLLSDHLGSPRLVVNTVTGEIVQRLDYDAFGRVLTDTNPGFQPFGFAGSLYDRDTGLVRFGARDYAPETGRWTAKDPIGFAGADPNLYSYVRADPINAIDPPGLFLMSPLPPVVTPMPPPVVTAQVPIVAQLAAAFAAGYIVGSIIDHYTKDWVQAQLDKIFGDPSEWPQSVANDNTKSCEATTKRKCNLIGNADRGPKVRCTWDCGGKTVVKEFGAPKSGPLSEHPCYKYTPSY
jgi:RHS repeat-associated protein